MYVELVEVVHRVLPLECHVVVLVLASLDIEAAGEPEDLEKLVPIEAKLLIIAEHVWECLKIPRPRARS
jgi:hypothetical protein